MSNLGKIVFLLVGWWLTVGRMDKLRAQSNGSGVLLVKPYAWSPKEEISNAYEFNSLADHNGYVSLNPDSRERQVQAALVVAVLYDASYNLKNIASEADLRPLVEAQTYLEGVSARYPSTRSALAGRIAAVKAEIERFRQSNLKVDGNWVSSADVRKRLDQAAAAQQQTRLETEKASLLQAFERSDTTRERCEQIVEKLKTEHSRDVQAQRVVTRWQNDKSVVAACHDEWKTFFRNVATDKTTLALANAQNVGQLHALPKELLTRFLDIGKRLIALSKTVHPSLMKTFEVETSTVSDLNLLIRALDNAQAGRVIVAADELAKEPSTPSTSTPEEYQPITAALQRCRQILKGATASYRQHCAQAKVFEKLGKTSQAIEEYQKAAEISKEPEVLAEIQKLREGSLGL